MRFFNRFRSCLMIQTTIWKKCLGEYRLRMANTRLKVAKSYEFSWIFLNLLEIPWIRVFLRNAWRTHGPTKSLREMFFAQLRLINCCIFNKAKYHLFINVTAYLLETLWECDDGWGGWYVKIQLIFIILDILRRDWWKTNNDASR